MLKLIESDSRRTVVDSTTAPKLQTVIEELPPHHYLNQTKTIQLTEGLKIFMLITTSSVGMTLDL